MAIFNNPFRHLKIFRCIIVGIILASTLLTACLSHATLFRNSYVSFELPPNWKCVPDGTEYVCENQFIKNSKEAIIILTAKEAGPTDSIEEYKKYLGLAKQVSDKTGRLVPSKVMQVKDRIIGGHTWVDSMHLGSEIISFYTRYLGTVKERIAILVTFSAHKNHFTKYSADFIKAVESLQVVAPKVSDNTMAKTIPSGGTEVMGAPIDVSFPADVAPTSGAKGQFKLDNEKIGILVLVVGALLFLLLRRKK